jgi:hypothetical protein
MSTPIWVISSFITPFRSTRVASCTPLAKSIVWTPK